jgi:hypothetical protein
LKDVDGYQYDKQDAQQQNQDVHVAHYAVFRLPPFQI